MESNKAIIFKNYSPLLLRGTPYQVTFGPYGIVQLAKSSKTGQVVAIKKLTCKVSQKQINFLKKIRHPNIIQLIDCYFQTKSQHTFLIFEYFQGRTLLQYIKLCYFKERDTTNKILLQLTQAISYLHSYSRYNLSVKPENVLLDSKNQAKFCFINIPLTQAPSIKPSRNLEYMSPEIFYDKKITDKNDIWSLGVLFYQIAEGVTPFSDFNAIQALGSFQKLSFSKKTKIQWVKMISQMLNPIAKQRPDLKDIIKKLEQTTNGGKSCEASKIQSDTSQIIQNKIKLVQINQLPQTSTKNLNSKRLTQVSQNNQSYFTKREQKCHHSYSIQGQQKISLKRFMTVQ